MKKNPIIAAIASFVFPGLGQILNGDTRKGIGYILIGLIFVSIFIFLIHSDHIVGPTIVSGASIVLLWITNIYDAYNSAKV